MHILFRHSSLINDSLLLIMLVCINTKCAISPKIYNIFFCFFHYLAIYHLCIRIGIKIQHYFSYLLVASFPRYVADGHKSLARDATKRLLIEKIRILGIVLFIFSCFFCTYILRTQQVNLTTILFLSSLMQK